MMSSSWRVLISEETDPMWNIALDEAILRCVVDNGSPNTVRIWRCSNSVIIGRSQDVRAEVNLELCKDLDIPIIRRCSGGGTVFVDLGSYNFSIIVDTRIITKVNSKSNVARFFSSGIANLLLGLGCHSKFVPPSNVFIDGWKVSGSAQYYLYEGILHHGTLLVDANLELMQKVLVPNPRLARDLRSVPSEPSPVKNLSTFLEQEFQPKEITSLLAKAIMNLFGGDYNVTSSISKSEGELTQVLIDSKYSDNCWLLGV